MYIYIYIYIYTTEILHNLRKNIFLFATTWMSLEEIMQSKISQTQKDKYCLNLVLPEI